MVTGVQTCVFRSPQQHRVTEDDGLLTELAEHDGRAIAHNNEPDDLVRHRADRPSESESTKAERYG